MKKYRIILVTVISMYSLISATNLTQLTEELPSLSLDDIMKHDNKIPYEHHYIENGKRVKEITYGNTFLRFLYSNKLGNLFRLFLIQTKINRVLSLYFHSRASKYHIRPFIKRYNINMDKAEKTVDQFSSFNDFFIRQLKPNSRAIDQKVSSFTSPADSKLFVIDNLSKESYFVIKGSLINLPKLLNNEQTAQKYYGGTMMIFRLAPYDYHRFHFPFDCTPHKSRFIRGTLDSVNPFVYTKGFLPFLNNQRYIFSLHSDSHKDITCIAVGALGVGKIHLTYKLETPYKKGDEMGYFEFGSSTLILLFPKDVISVDKKFLSNSAKNYETAVRMGESIAELKK